jgi:hypothetical protein
MFPQGVDAAGIIKSAIDSPRRHPLALQSLRD